MTEKERDLLYIGRLRAAWLSLKEAETELKKGMEHAYKGLLLMKTIVKENTNELTEDNTPD